MLYLHSFPFTWQNLFFFCYNANNNDLRFWYLIRYYDHALIWRRKPLTMHMLAVIFFIIIIIKRNNIIIMYYATQRSYCIQQSSYIFVGWWFMVSNREKREEKKQSKSIRDEHYFWNIWQRCDIWQNLYVLIKCNISFTLRFLSLTIFSKTFFFALLKIFIIL